MFSGHRVTRPAQVELAVQPVCHDVRHGANHTGGGPASHHAVARYLQLFGIVDLVGQPPAHSESCHLGIATHPDNDTRRVRRQTFDQLVDVEGRTEKCQLLGLCLLEIVWRETGLSEIEEDFGHPRLEYATVVAAGNRLTYHQMICYRSGFVPISH